MFFICDNTFSSTIGCPVGVNFVGFQPNSKRYSPICFREPRLKGSESRRTRCWFGSLENFSYSSSDSLTFLLSPLTLAILERLPALVYTAVSSIDVSRGLNVLCTFFSAPINFSFNSAKSSIACC